MGGIDKKESSRLLYIFTRDFGLVMAHTQGVRDLKSKLRFALQDFSYSSIDVVKGKNGWRVVNAQSQENLFHLASRRNADYAGAMIARIVRIVRRLVRGEEKNEQLFDEIVNTHHFLTNNTLTKDEVFYLEIIVVMRILNILGYWGTNSKLAHFLDGDSVEAGSLKKVEEVKAFALSEINKALKETQL